MGFLLSRMTKKIVAIILVVITFVNIVAGAFLFLDIQTLQAPETILKMELVELNADEAVLHTSLWINNPNSFAVSFQNLTVTTTTDTRDVINNLVIEGGEVAAQNNRTFNALAPIRFNGTLPTQLTSKITGTIGMTILGVIKKTLPLKFTMVTSLNTIVNQFTFPSIHLDGNFSDITQEGINFTGIVQITNPYTFPIAVDNLSLNMITDKGIPVGSLVMAGTMIPAITMQQLTGSGRLLLKVLDSKTLHMSINGELIVYVAGLKQSLNLSLESTIIVPRIERLLTGHPMDSTLSSVYKFTLKGFLETISFEIVNPNKIAFLATDLTVSIYRIDRNNTRLIGNGTLEKGIIAPQATTILHGDVLIPYSRMIILFKERILPDRFQVIMRANITIPGLNQTIWVGMVAYQDIRT